MMHRFNTSLGNNNQNFNDHELYDHQYADMYNQFTSSSSVDCTLSLGTPSTRLSEYDYNYNYNYNDKTSIQHDNSSDSCVSTFCWDSPHYNKNSTTTSSSTSHRNTSNRRGHYNNGNSKNVDDHLLAQRRCANCDTTSTPLWRNGPRGPKSLCNACGIRFKKEERRASGISQSQAQKMPCPNEFRFMDEDNEEPETGISFLSSWSHNVSEGPSFVHDFTRY